MTATGGRADEVDTIVLSLPHEAGQFVANDFDHLLGGSKAFQNFLAGSALANSLGEILDNLEVDIRFQKNEANFPEGFTDGFLGKVAAAAEFLENGIKFFG